MEEPGDPSINPHHHIPSSASADSSVKEALRIQAAAVAAQQAALIEEELRLEQRLEALEHHEKQLGTYLEQERQGLDLLRSETRKAHENLRQDRGTFESQVAAVLDQVIGERQELEGDRAALKEEREHLLNLRKRMIERWRRHWVKERSAIERQWAELNQARKALEVTARRTQREKRSQERRWLKANGKLELKRRELAEARHTLKSDQLIVARAVRNLAEREATVEKRQRDHVAEKAEWEARKANLIAEIEGLESRARNSRDKLKELEKSLTAQSPMISYHTPHIATQPLAPFVADDVAPASPETTALTDLMAELGDERQLLAEECLRFTQAQLQWQELYRAIACDLETLDHRLGHSEETIRYREAELDRREKRLAEQAQGMVRGHAQLEASKILLSAQNLTWQGEKERLLLDLEHREQRLEEQWQATCEMRQRWDDRREKQVLRLRAQLHALADLKRESIALRQEFLERRSALDQEKSRIAEQHLALEQLHQEYAARADDSAAAEKRLGALLQQCSKEAASIEPALAKERRSIQGELAHLGEHLEALKKYHTELASRETAVARRETAFEETVTERQDDPAKQLKELALLRDQQKSYEVEIRNLRDDIERLAYLLLDRSVDDSDTIAQAA
jgi:hypothetical protein